MNTCRICLQNKNILFSLYDSVKGLNINYAAIMSSLTDVKAWIDKGSSDMICLLCRKKLKDFYEFKRLIERSNLKINKFKNLFKFNSIDEVDIWIEIGTKELKNVLNYNSISKGDSVCCHNTTIKRVNKDEGNVPVGDCIESVKTEQINTNENELMELSDNNTISAYEGYNYKMKKKNILQCKENWKKKCCIKPVFRNDLRVMKTYIPKEGMIRRNIKEEAYTLREDLCPYCGKKTKAIRSHILQHTAERKFSCNNCNKSYYTKQNLETHIKTHFMNEMNEKFKCDHCISSFSSKGALARHMVTHTDVREFSCKVCEKTFKWKGCLHRHMLTHSFAKRFRCEKCSMSFATKDAFQHHYRVHTGERPYKCELCSQPYSYKRDFNRHCLKKHGVFVDRRPVKIMNEEVLKREKKLMQDLILQIHGIKTEREPLDYFQGPQGALAFAKAVKVIQNKEILKDYHL